MSVACWFTIIITANIWAQGLEQGMPFPAFSDYQDTFSSPLTSATFAAFAVPSWIPSSVHLVRLARVIYPYWKERRVERGGHRIIPTLNVSGI